MKRIAVIGAGGFARQVACWMGTPMSGVIVIGTSMLLSVAGLMPVRRYVNIDCLRRHHEVASYFYDWNALCRAGCL